MPGVALPAESSGWAAWSSSSGMWRESFGRWPLVPVVEPGVVVVMGGGEVEMAFERTGVCCCCCCCGLLESTLWERGGGGAGRST